MIHVYLRVSTTAQDVDNQRHGINEWLVKHGYEAGSVAEDSESGALDWRKRKLGLVIEQLRAGDVLVCAEVSRLARSMLQVLEIMQEAAKREASIVIVKSGLVLDGSMQAKIMVTVLGLCAELEREFIRARTTEALRARKEKGLPLGRPEGSTGKSKLDAQERQIREYLEKGLNITAVAKLCSCQRATLYAWLDKKGISYKLEK
jgi:DNA invertase Pin-like site-specific DNA recombinase